jgi:hypothetical protein
MKALPVMPTPARSLASELPFPGMGLQAFVHYQWLVGPYIDELYGLPTGVVRDDSRWRRRIGRSFSAVGQAARAWMRGPD